MDYRYYVWQRIGIVNVDPIIGTADIVVVEAFSFDQALRHMAELGVTMALPHWHFRGDRLVNKPLLPAHEWEYAERRSGRLHWTYNNASQTEAARNDLGEIAFSGEPRTGENGFTVYGMIAIHLTHVQSAPIMLNRDLPWTRSGERSRAA